MTAATARSLRREPSPAAGGGSGCRRIGLYAFLTSMALVWLFPLAWAIYTALRPFSDTAGSGLHLAAARASTSTTSSMPGPRATSRTHFLNTLIVMIPAVIVTLLLASMVAFAVSRFSWRFNLAGPAVFTAGNLLPPQVIIIPLFQMYNCVPRHPGAVSDNGLLYDQYFGIVRHQRRVPGRFCIFVLSNYMKTLPHELTEAALVDGASVLRIWAAVIMPLCRPALAALATLEFTLIYNDFFWALRPDQERRPATHHLGAQQPPGPVLHGQQPDRRRRDDRGHPDDHRVPRPPEAVHQRAHARRDQGLTRGAPDARRQGGQTA